MRHLLRASLLALFLLAMAPGHGRAADAYADALGLYQSGAYAEAQKRFRALALKGHAGAEAMLGIMYFEGQGVAADPAIAAAWFMKSALKGHGSAQLALGALYAKGQGVGRDVEEAYKWLSLAERHGGDIAEEARRLKRKVEPELAPETRARVLAELKAWRPTVPFPQ